MELIENTLNEDKGIQRTNWIISKCHILKELCTAKFKNEEYRIHVQHSGCKLSLLKEPAMHE